MHVAPPIDDKQSFVSPVGSLYRRSYIARKPLPWEHLPVFLAGICLLIIYSSGVIAFWASWGEAEWALFTR
jgi:hypothetical protein